MIRTAVCLCLALFAASAVSAQNLTWGRDGHSIMAAVAQAYLTPHAANMTNYLLPEVGGDMSKVANWADEVRKQLPWSYVLHFVDTPDWECKYNYNRDCIDHEGSFELHRCADGAIQNYTKRVSNASLSLAARNEALKFLIHFIGDIHQPLHASFLGDRGGNDITGYFNDQSVNLHGMWDYTLIEQRMKDFGSDRLAYRNWFIAQLQSTWLPYIPAWQKCDFNGRINGSPFAACSTQWTVESLGLACQVAYRDENGQKMLKGFHVGDAYYNQKLPVIEEQLAKAAVRLATVLNAIWP